MPKTDTITQERLRELLHYNPATGEFTWLVGRGGAAGVGTIAGTPSHGYINIGIDRGKYLAHRLAYLYVEGWMPEQVDHDDQVRDNNRWINLNTSTGALNMKNKKLQSNNSSGTCGVYWNKCNKKWQAYISVYSKQVYLGSFSKKRNAISARQAANIKHEFHKNHGNPKAT